MYVYMTEIYNSNISKRRRQVSDGGCVDALSVSCIHPFSGRKTLISRSQASVVVGVVDVGIGGVDPCNRGQKQNQTKNLRKKRILHRI